MKKQKPLIKLVRTPNGYYFFETNQDTIHEVDRETYLELERMMNHGGSVSESASLTALREEGWLSDHRPLEIRNTLMEQVDYRLEHHLSQLNLQITQSCNLRCIYCPYSVNTDPLLSRTHTGKRMSFETAKKAIDYMADRSDDMESVAVSFYGGEPLICFPLMKQCIEYAETVFDGKEVRFYITTNATLMTDSVIDYLAAHKVYITFSLDGPKPVHDRHRCTADGSPTYDLVMETLRKTVTRYGNDAVKYVNINMVINPSDDFDAIIQWLEDPVFRGMIIRTAFAEDDYLEKKFPMSREFRKKYTYQLALSWLDYLGIVDGLKTNKLSDAAVYQGESDGFSSLNESGLLPEVMSPGGPCIAGVRKLFVNTDGNFYPCEKVNELSPCMCIGNVDRGIDPDQVKRHLNIGQLTAETCRQCWAIVHCAVCQRMADGGEELSAVVKNRNCGSVRENTMKTIRTNLMLRELQRMQTKGQEAE